MGAAGGSLVAAGSSLVAAFLQVVTVDRNLRTGDWSWRVGGQAMEPRVKQVREGPGPGRGPGPGPGPGPGHSYPVDNTQVVLRGKTVLILGYGRVGSQVGAACRGLGMQVSTAEHSLHFTLLYCMLRDYMYGTTLHCMVLHCTVIPCNTLPALYCISLHCPVLHSAQSNT